MPTVRTDLAPPRIKRVSDRVNYGDESDAYGLTNPSIFSSKGIYEKDFLMPRSKDEVCSVFILVTVNRNIIQDLYYNY